MVPVTKPLKMWRGKGKMLLNARRSMSFRGKIKKKGHNGVWLVLENKRKTALTAEIAICNRGKGKSMFTMAGLRVTRALKL